MPSLDSFVYCCNQRKHARNVNSMALLSQPAKFLEEKSMQLSLKPLSTPNEQGAPVDHNYGIKIWS